MVKRGSSLEGPYFNLKNYFISIHPIGKPFIATKPLANPLRKTALSCPPMVSLGLEGQFILA